MEKVTNRWDLRLKKRRATNSFKKRIKKKALEFSRPKKKREIKWPPSGNHKKFRAWMVFRNKFLEDKKNFEGYYICSSCGSWKENIELDHIVPRSLAPNRVFDPENIQLLCRRCHFNKTNFDKRKLNYAERQTQVQS